MMRLLKSLISSLSHYQRLIPSVCLICSKSHGLARNICQACRQDLPSLTHHCPRCAQFLAVDGICGHCLRHPPPFKRTHALFPYQAPIIGLISGLKFHKQLNYALALGELLAEKVLHEWYVDQALPDLLIPVPLHPKRLQERGFNQALEIAAPLAAYLPIDKTGVKRVKNTQAQSQLPAKERAANLAGAFHLTRDYTGLSLAVIDDVMTTGHTLFELCQTLKQGGAKEIEVWCCARRG